jgi:hypothetical protein
MLQDIILALGICVGALVAYFWLLSKARISFLTRRKKEDDDQQADILFDVLTCWYVRVLVGDDIHDIRPLDLLSFFWENQPDSPCEDCHEPFDSGQRYPVRTVSLEGDTGKKPFIFIMRARNRHFDCSQRRKTSIFPVSHVWDESISKAHHEMTPNFDAQLALFQTIFRVLTAVDSSFRSQHDVPEIWHDYVSVPQWKSSIQQALLLSLPALFAMAETILVHLDDISLQVVSNMFYGKVGEIENLRATGQFFQARWFRRMWTILEFASSQNASIITSDHQVVYWFPGGDGAKLENSFTFMWVMGMSQYLEKFPKYVREKDARVQDIVPLNLENIYIQQIRPRIRIGNTLGEVIGIIGPKRCYFHRDRFIAICALLDLGDHASISQDLPKDSLEACRWVLWECLKRGDCTPLLLNPSGESEIPGASWIKIHECMDESTWTLGQRVGSQELTMVMIRDGKIRPELISVGIVEEAYVLDFAHEKIESFRTILSLLLRIHGHEYAEFISAMIRIYGVPEHLQPLRLPTTLAQAVEQTPNFESKLRAFLDTFATATAEKQNDVCLYICDLMGLLEPMKSQSANVLHMSEGSDISSHLHNTVVILRCRGCRQRFLFKLVLYTKNTVGAEVYRLPGIHFTTTAADGVGIVLLQNKIIGRMSFGVPPCECNIRELVEIL